MTCIIVEDQPPAQRILKKYIRDIGLLELKGVFADALSAMQFIESEMVDIMFLDIHLPKLSGVQMIKILDKKPNIVLTTAFSDYAIDGYELDVIDYLLKPFSFERFVKAVTKVKHKSTPLANSSTIESPKQADFIFAKAGSEYVNVEISSITYIKADGDYTEVHFGYSKKLINNSLRFWKEQLSGDIFCQVHKSYLVNVSCIEKVSGSQLFIKGQYIPIGRTYKEAFFAKHLGSGTK
ncbi:MAG: DNA-binding LytR/AlgR family response regulator [Saprospiraceae bacterium]|jgi:DNA-binding LytR/AlgR family response regulator